DGGHSDAAFGSAYDLLEEAAAEISCLRTDLDKPNGIEVALDAATAEIAALRAALEPFAEIGQWLFARQAPDDELMLGFQGINGYEIALTRGHFKAAHSALHERGASEQKAGGEND